MLFILLLTQLFTLTNSNPMTIDFGENTGGQDWNIINDGVMGGLSKGYVSYTDNTLLFNGSVSLENNGGFTSYKSPFSKVDLSSYETIEIRMRSTGQQIALTLETNRIWCRPYYKMDIPATDEWQVITMDLNDFDRYVIGRNTGEKLTKEALANILRIGFTTNSKKASSFEMEVDYITFKPATRKTKSL